MSDLNCGAWAGRVITKPEPSTSKSGLKTVWFMLACQHFIKDEGEGSGWREHTDKLPVIAWNYQAERLAKANIGVGSYITISGRLQTFETESKFKGSDGLQYTLPVTGFEIVVEAFNVVTRVQALAQAQERGGADNRSQRPETTASKFPGSSKIRSEQELEEELPF